MKTPVRVLNPRPNTGIAEILIPWKHRGTSCTSYECKWIEFENIFVHTKSYIVYNKLSEVYQMASIYGVYKIELLSSMFSTLNGFLSELVL